MLPPVSSETKQTNYDMYRHVITIILALVALTASAQKTVIEGTVLDAQGNIIAVKEGHENDEGIKALVEVLKSDEIVQFINDTYDGAVVPFAE